MGFDPLLVLMCWVAMTTRCTLGVVCCHLPVVLPGARLPSGLPGPGHGRGHGIHRHGDRRPHTESDADRLQGPNSHHNRGEVFLKLYLIKFLFFNYFFNLFFFLS